MSTVAESVRRFFAKFFANRGDRTAGKSFCRFCQSSGLDRSSSATPLIQRQPYQKAALASNTATPLRREGATFVKKRSVGLQDWIHQACGK
jgi:hypothetical protein